MVTASLVGAIDASVAWCLD
uniref:Uncharacterized protein n=1 Tax=Arundo donax TaxID=35708 RepID=A0A0A9FPX5_ARUDO